MHSRPATYWRALYVQVGSTPALPDSPRRQSTTSVSAQRPLSWTFGVALRVRAAAVQWVGQQRERPHMFGQDHREVDFLICQNGAWGILEVSYHPDRYERDAEKDVWFKQSGILCIQHYTSESCYTDAAKKVVSAVAAAA